MTSKKIFSLLCCSALMLTFAGCKKNNNTVKPVTEGSESTAVTTTIVTQTGEVGKDVEMADVEININKFYKSNFYGTQDATLSAVFFFDVTITNNTDKDIDANMLTSFEFEVDGKPHDSATLFAISSIKKQFGDDAKFFSDTLKPGDTQSGYISAELPDKFETVTLKFLPLGGAKNERDESQAIVYTFTQNDFEYIYIESYTQTSDASSTSKTSKTSTISSTQKTSKTSSNG